MTNSGWDYFTILLWKNQLISWRHKIQFILKICLPIFICYLITSLRELSQPQIISTNTIYKPINIDRIEEIKGGLPNVKWELAYAPKNPILENLVQMAADSLKIPMTSLDSPSNLETYMLKSNALAGVDFSDDMKSITSLPEEFQYGLRFPSALRSENQLNLTWMTRYIYPEIQFPGPRNPEDNDGGLPPGYIKEGFIAVQNAISTSYIKLVKDKNLTLPKIQLQRFPYPPYVNDLFIDVMSEITSLVIVVSFWYPCSLIIKYLVVEKEKKLKEVMKIMGLSTWVHWTAHFFEAFLFFLVSTFFITILFTMKSNVGLALFDNTSAGVMYLFFIIYSIASINFCFMISSFFWKSNTAASMFGLLWFIAYIPFRITKQSLPTASLGKKLFICLFSNSAMSYGFELIFKLERVGLGLKSYNLFKSSAKDDPFTLGYVMIMLLIDALIYILITLYLEKIIPGTYGIAEKWNFPFKKEYWMRNKVYIESNERSDITLNDHYVEENFEKYVGNEKAGIQVQKLRKKFGEKNVVNGLSIKMYENEITALLGHNGAGKTTLFSMITGLLPPTKGTVYVNNYDILKNLRGVRESLGFCPQYDILFDELTVKEHIIFYSRLKGVDKNKIDEEIDKYVKLLRLEDKINSQASKLSGGMQRKLSVGVALCGGSKVVLFDEPTAGMDPAARRNVWDLLQAEKQNRTILLTTHLMDEVDVLCDRIAILANGNLITYGTPFFLKKRFGVGYHLICVKQPHCETSQVTDLLRKHIPDITVYTDIGNELSYLLPDDKSSVFEKMLRELEDSTEALDLEGCGMSLTTLEEVFVRCGKDTDIEESTSHMLTDKPFVTLFDDTNNQIVEGITLQQYQWEAMFLKKIYYSIRNWSMILIQIALPLIFVCSTLISDNQDSFLGLPDLAISLKSYDESVTILSAGVTKTVQLRNIAIAYKKMLEMEEYSLITVTEDMGVHLLDLSENILGHINTDYMIAASILPNSIIAWFNNQAYHTAPLSLNVVHNAIAKSILGEKYSIQVINYPLPFDAQYRKDALDSGSSMGFELAINYIFGMAFVTPIFVLFLIKERKCKAKLLQYLSGVNVFIFWMANFIWDFVIMVVIAILSVLLLAIFQETGFATFTELMLVFLLIITFSFSCLPLTYLTASIFTDPTTGYSWLSIFNIFTGVVLLLVNFATHLPIVKDKSTGDLLQSIFLICPHFSLAHSFSNLITYANTNSFCKMSCELLPVCNMENICEQIAQCCRNRLFGWSNPGILAPFVYMLVTGVIFFLILYFIEYKYFNIFLRPLLDTIKSLFRPRIESSTVDEDVREEKIRINAMTMNEMKDHNLIGKDLTKWYGKFLAVNRLYVEVKKYECFGLLGVNGAGKTSTFQMLTGDAYITNGDAFVKGYSVKNNINMVYKNIGYCPQFDAMLEDLTGAETLYIFCLIRGIPAEKILSMIAQLAFIFDLEKHLYKQIKNYSGGNKRKLSTAIAMVGNPSVIYLDEPTTGIDPSARRKLWNVVCRVRDMGKSIVLTSHSMDECEALCTRLAIMVNGEFKCIGSTQHLKNRFSHGLSLIIKLEKKKIDDTTTPELRHPDEDFDYTRVVQFVQTKFPKAVVKETHNGVVTLTIPTEHIRWSEIFGLMESNKKRLNIEDYSVSQSTLEQVFLGFAKKQYQQHI